MKSKYLYYIFQIIFNYGLQSKVHTSWKCRSDFFNYGKKCHLNMGKKWRKNCHMQWEKVCQMDFFLLADSKNDFKFICHLKFCHNRKIYLSYSRFSYLRNSFIRASIKITQYYFFWKHFKGGVSICLTDWTIYFWVCFFSISMGGIKYWTWSNCAS